MEPPRPTQEEEFLKDVERWVAPRLPFPPLVLNESEVSTFDTLFRPFANDPKFAEAFTRDTGHSVPSFLIQPQGKPLAGLTVLRRAALKDFLVFIRYVLNHLKAQDTSPSPEISQRPHAELYLYAQDFYTWTQVTATQVRDGNWDAIDSEALAEEIDGLGISQKHALGSHLRNLVMHLLKWRYEPSGRQTGHSWQSSISNARDEIAILLEISPSLQRLMPEFLARRYPAARRQAARETGLPLTTFPETCPWEPAQILDDDFWPEV